MAPLRSGWPKVGEHNVEARHLSLMEAHLYLYLTGEMGPAVVLRRLMHEPDPTRLSVLSCSRCPSVFGRCQVSLDFVCGCTSLPGLKISHGVDPFHSPHPLCSARSSKHL